MFTGIIRSIGLVDSVDRSDEGVRITVATPLADELATGDSIAVNGVCLTAASASAGSFVAEVMNETLAKTSLSDTGAAAQVNLELPLRAGDPLGGHMVQGHVDGVGVISGVRADGFARRVRIEAPSDVLRYIVEKGSVAVDGVSLTVVTVDEESFEVSLIPETLERTSLGRAQAGTRANLEVDVIAKYVEKAVRGAAFDLDNRDRHNQGEGSGVTPKRPVTRMETAG
jgi:riboflavin synthase